MFLLSAMINRNLVSYTLLFLGSYAGFMSDYWSINRQHISLLPAMLSKDSVANGKLSSAVIEPDGIAGMVRQRGSAAVKTATAPSSEQTMHIAVTDGPSSATVMEMATFAELAVTESDPEQRSDYIVGMGNGTKMPGTIQALTTVITSDQVAGNRVLAVAALRTLSIQGDDDGSLRNALRLAATDSNSRVSAMAIEALKEVERRLGS